MVHLIVISKITTRTDNKKLQLIVRKASNHLKLLDPDIVNKEHSFPWMERK